MMRETRPEIAVKELRRAAEQRVAKLREIPLCLNNQNHWNECSRDVQALLRSMRIIIATNRPKLK